MLETKRPTFDWGELEGSSTVVIGKIIADELIEELSSDLHRLDAVQGSSEARTEPYREVLRGSTGTADDVVRQESGELSAMPASRTDDGEV